MGAAGGRAALQRPRLMLLGRGGGGKSTLLAALHALQALDDVQAPPGGDRSAALVQELCRRLEECLAGHGAEGLATWVAARQEGGADGLVKAVAAAGGPRMPLLEAKCLAAAAWAAHGGSGEGFWGALMAQGHHVSVGVEQRPLSLGPEGPEVQAVDFAGQPEYFCCHPEFFATYGALYVIVCPLVAAREEGHGQVPEHAWDGSVEAYRERLRPWLALLHSSPVGQYHDLQRSERLPANTVVVTSFADKVQREEDGWKGAVRGAVEEACGTDAMRMVPLANSAPLLLHYGGCGATEEQVVDLLLSLRNCLAEQCSALAGMEEHPQCFVEMRSTIFEAARKKGDYLWSRAELDEFLMSEHQWISAANTDRMSLTESIAYGLEFLDSIGDVKILKVGETEVVLIDPIEALSKLLCRFIPAKEKCECDHCLAQKKTLAMEERNHQGWLLKSVVEDLLENYMERLGICFGEKGAWAGVELMKAFGLCYEAQDLPRARRSSQQQSGGLRKSCYRRESRRDGPPRYLAFPARMGRPESEFECLGSVVAAARRRQLLAVCLRLSYERNQLQTFLPSVLSRLQCWLAEQEQATAAVMDVTAYMRSCRGLAHLSAGDGTVVYVELAEIDRQTLHVAVFGREPLSMAEEVMARVDARGFRLESLCPACVDELPERGEAVDTLSGYILTHTQSRGRPSGLRVCEEQAHTVGVKCLDGHVQDEGWKDVAFLLEVPTACFAVKDCTLKTRATEEELNAAIVSVLRSIELNDEERQDIDIVTSAVADVLDRVSLPVKKFVMSGSTSRGTGISPLHDVDFLLHMREGYRDCRDKDGGKVAPYDLLRQLASDLAEESFESFPQKRSVRTVLHGRAVDLVPVFGEEEPLHISDVQLKDWIETSPAAYTKLFKERNDDSGDQLRQAVQLVKQWRATMDKRSAAKKSYAGHLGSFQLERLLCTMRTAVFVEGTWVERMAVIFGEMAKDVYDLAKEVDRPVVEGFASECRTARRLLREAIGKGDARSVRRLLLVDD